MENKKKTYTNAVIESAGLNDTLYCYFIYIFLMINYMFLMDIF